MGSKLFISVDKEELPKVGTSIDTGRMVYSTDENEGIIEEISEEKGKKINFYILRVQREVSRGLFTGKIKFGSLRYESIENGVYFPGDEGWRERHDFLKIRRKVKT